MELYDAIQTITEQFGKDIIKEYRFANIIADIFPNRDYPAINVIIKTMIKDEYCSEILTSLSSPSWNVKSKVMVEKLAIHNGYKEELVQYIFDSFFYGIEKKGEKPRLKKTVLCFSRNMAELEISLKKLKVDYLNYIEENVMISDNAPAFFLANDKSDIYEFQAKIKILNKVLGKEDNMWCNNRLNEVIKNNSPSPQKQKRKGFFQRLFG